MKKRLTETPATVLAPLVEQIARLTGSGFDGVFIHDAGTIVNVTRDAAALFGCADDELRRRRLSDFIARESRPALLDHLCATGFGSCPAVGVRKDGTSFPVEVTVKANLTLNGRRLQVLALRDLSRDDAGVAACRSDGAPDRNRKAQQRKMLLVGARN